MNKTLKLNLKPQLQKTSVSGSRYVPMLFSTPMVQSLLNGTKKETRRTQGLEKINENPDKWLCKQINGLLVFTDVLTSEEIFITPKINVNDIIWVRETFKESLNPNEFCYKADTDNPIYLDKNWKWKPSLFMPKTACRIFLKCVSVHAERLQDIDEESAINEGVEFSPEFGYKLYSKNDFFSKHLSASDSYMSLWEKINGNESWKSNPFVLVYKFAPDDFR